MLYCASCGSMMNDDARFCPHCGMPVSEVAHTESDYAGLTIDVETGRQMGEGSFANEPTRMMYDRPVHEVPTSPVAETIAAPPLAPQAEAAPYADDVYMQQAETASYADYGQQPGFDQGVAYERLGYGQGVAYEQPGFDQGVAYEQQPGYGQGYPDYSVTSYQARRAAQRSNVPIVAVVAVGIVVMLVAVLHLSGMAPWVRSEPSEPEAPTVVTAEPEQVEEEPAVEVAPESEASESAEEPVEEQPEEETAAQPADEYVLPDSDTHAYTAEELGRLSDWELFIARNEIYARHGRLFQNAQLQEYFSAQSWYQGSIAPEAFDESLLTDTEHANANLIREVEQSRGSAYL